MGKVRVTRFDPAEHLDNDEVIAAYIADAFETGDPSDIAAALGDVARAKGMSRLAEETGLNREGLYRALSGEGNPELATVMKILRALGIRLSAHAA